MNLVDLFKRQITVAHIFGIPVRFDYRWFLVFLLSVWLIAVNLARGGMFVGTSGCNRSALWPHGPSASSPRSVFFFPCWPMSSHTRSWDVRKESRSKRSCCTRLADWRGLRNEPQSPGAEFRIAIAGPAASFVFASLSVLSCCCQRCVPVFSMHGGVLLLLCAGNLLLAIFNLFPGYPLDGGRVLRAILWRRSGDMREATRLSGICGMLIAAILIIFGVYMAVAPTFRSPSWASGRCWSDCFSSTRRTTL